MCHFEAMHCNGSIRSRRILRDILGDPRWSGKCAVWQFTLRVNRWQRQSKYRKYTKFRRQSVLSQTSQLASSRYWNLVSASVLDWEEIWILIERKYEGKYNENIPQSDVQTAPWQVSKDNLFWTKWNSGRLLPIPPHINTDLPNWIVKSRWIQMV